MTQATPNKTLVTLLLDRSASMQEIKPQTISAINVWLKELRKTKDDMRFSLVQFDYFHDDVKPEIPEHAAPTGSVAASAWLGGRIQTRPFGNRMTMGTSGYKMQLEKTHVAVPVKDVPDLTSEDFQPRGGTPLIDAAFATIRAIESSLEGRTDVKVILAIQTDGEERHSVENTWESLKSLVAEKEAAGWEILFMGAGIDAYAQATRMGVSRDKTLSYGKNENHTRAAFETTAAKSVLFASGDAGSMAYTTAEKLRSGDRG